MRRLSVSWQTSRPRLRPSQAASPSDVLLDAPAPAVSGIESDQRTPEGPPRKADCDRSDRRPTAMELGEAYGVVPDGVTVFDDRCPTVANHDPALLRALRRAATDAAKDRVEFEGWGRFLRR